MALSIHNWTPPDTSFIGQLIQAGQAMQQRRAEAQASQAAEAARLAAQQEQARRREDFDREQALTLANQFQVQHAFKEAQTKRENAIEDEGRLPYNTTPANALTGPALPPSGAPASLAGSAEPFNPGDPLAGAAVAAPASPAEDLAGMGEWMTGPGGDTTDAPPHVFGKPPVDASPAVLPELGALPEPPPLKGARQVSGAAALAPQGGSGSITDQLAALDTSLRALPVTRDQGRKAVVSAAQQMAVNQARPYHAAGGMTPETMADGSIRIGASIYRKNPTTGQLEKVGVTQRVGQPLVGPNGETVVPMANGKFLVDGVVQDTMPNGVGRIEGQLAGDRLDLAEQTAKERKALAEDRNKIARENGAARGERVALEQTRADVESNRREADRAQTDLEQFKKTAMRNAPYKQGDKFMMGIAPITEERYKALLSTYEKEQEQLATLNERIKKHREAADTAQKKLDTAMQAERPNQNVTPAVPTPAPAPVPGTPPAAAVATPNAPRGEEIAVPGGEGYPVGTRAKLNGKWMKKQPSGKWLAE